MGGADQERENEEDIDKANSELKKMIEEISRNPNPENLKLAEMLLVHPKGEFEADPKIDSLSKKQRVLKYK